MLMMIKCVRDKLQEELIKSKVTIYTHTHVRKKLYSHC